MRDPENPWQDELAAQTPTPAIGPTQTELRRQAIDACDRCDTDGYDGLTVCQHTPDNPAEIARRRSAEIRAQMGWQPAPGVVTPEGP